MTRIYLEFYKTSRGDNPVIDYIQGIDDQDEVAEIYDFFDCLDKEGESYGR